MDKVVLKDKLSSFSDVYVPKIIGELNGQLVKVVKCEGQYVWHRHEREDELFLVLEGRLLIHLRDRTVELGEGEFMIVERGVEHKPEAPAPASVLLFEPAATRNTGDVDHEYTIEPEDLQRL